MDGFHGSDAFAPTCTDALQSGDKFVKGPKINFRLLRRRVAMQHMAELVFSVSELPGSAWSAFNFTPIYT